VVLRVVADVQLKQGHAEGGADGRRQCEEGAGVFVEFEVLYCSREEAIGNEAAAAEMCVC
jgi:hypothetical protein